jgi:iron complex outermembrane recepter protein
LTPFTGRRFPDNLLNENIRNSVSYNKDEVLLPGIGVRAFANLKF